MDVPLPELGSPLLEVSFRAQDLLLLKDRPPE